MARPSKRKRSIREVVKERERQRKARKIQEERGWESSEVEEDVTAPGLLQKSTDQERADSSSEESWDDEVLVSEPEELDEIDESAFAKLMASAVEQPGCVRFLECLVPELTICRETNSGRSTMLKYQRGSAPTEHHRRRVGRQQREREKTMEGCRRLPDLFRNAARTRAERLNAEVSTASQKTATGGEEPASIPAVTVPASDRKGRKECSGELKAPSADPEEAFSPSPRSRRC